MRLLLILLLLNAAGNALPEEVEMEGLETLVALNAPASEENEGETKKARLTLFDDKEVAPSKPIDGKEPQLRYVAPKSTTPTPLAITATAASTTTVATPTTTTTVAATTPSSTTVTATTPAATTVPTTTLAVTDTTTVTATSVAPTSTEPTPTSTTSAATTTVSAAEKKMEKLAELAMQKPILIPIPLPSKEILQAIVETSEPILIQLPYLPKVEGVITAGQSIQGNPWGTEAISDEKAALSAEVTVPPPVEIGSELDMGETSPFLPSHSPSHLPVITPNEKKEEDKMNAQDMERAQILMTALRAMKSEVEETLRQINEREKSVMAVEETRTSPSTTAIPSTSTTSASTTTTTAATTTSEIPSTTTSSVPSTTTTASPSTTRRPIPVDEVKSTEAVQIDSDAGEEKIKVTPNNDAVVLVDSATTKASKRIVGYTKTVPRVVDNDRTRATKVYKKLSHDNSFLHSEEGEVRQKVPKILPKKRHLIENGEEAVTVKKIKKRLRRKIKKVVSSSPNTPESTPPPTATPLPSTTPLPPPPTPVPATARRFLVQRAAESQAPPQFQVSPAVVQSVQPQLPIVAHAAPIYRPQLYPTLNQQPQYYPPPPPPQQQQSLQSLQPLLQQPSSPYLQLPQLQQMPQLPIRYEPVVYYRPVYGRKKRETVKGKHDFLFKKEQKEVRVTKAKESRFSRVHSVVSPSISKKKHERVFEKRVILRKVNETEKKTEENLRLPKSPVLRKSSFEPHMRTKRVKRGTDLSEVNSQLDEIERALMGHQRPVHTEDKEERHTGVDELASELDIIEKMKGRGKGEIEESDLMEDEEEEEEDIPETEEEEKATANYKKPVADIEELRSLEDSVHVNHEQMGKHPEGELKLNKGERPKLFSHGRTITEQIRGEVESADYEYDAEIANSFAAPASDNELEQLYHARLRAAELAPVSPTAVPLRKRRHRKTQREEVEQEAAIRRRSKKRRATTTETPTTTSSPRRTRRPATIIPNFHPKEASPDTGSLASLPNLPEEEESTTIRARALRRNRRTHEPKPTTTETPETTTRRTGRPARVLNKKEAAFSLPAGGSRLFYDSVSQVVTRSPPQAPPTLIPQQSPPTISPALSIDELAGLPREALLAELKRLNSQLDERRGEEEETAAPTAVVAATTPHTREEEIVDEEDRELIEAIHNGEKRAKESDPFEFLRERKVTTTTVATTTKKEEPDLFSFDLPTSLKGERLAVEDLVVSDAVNEASIGQDLDKILADVGAGDNSIGTRKRAIEAIMEFKKKKFTGDSKAKKCLPGCTEEKLTIPKDDLEFVSQLQAVNMKHPLAKDGKFSLFATNKKSYYILPDGRVLVVNEQSKLARTNSGEELHLEEEEEESEEAVGEYPPDELPSTTTPLPTTVAPRRRTTTTAATTTQKKRVRTRPPTTTPYPIEASDYEEALVESATIPIRPSVPPLSLPRVPEMRKVVIPWRTTTPVPLSTTTRRVYIHDGGIEPSQVTVIATSRTPPTQKDQEEKHFPATTLENDATTVEAEMSREELIKYLESIDLAKTFGGKSLDEQTPHDEKFEKAVSKTAEDEYTDEVEYEDSVTEEQEKKSPTSSQVNADPKSVDDIDLRKWFTIGKDNAARRKKGDGMAETILEAASEVPDEEVAEDEFLAEESVNLFPDDFVRVLRSVAGGERVPMRMLRRLGLRLRAARLRRH